MLKIKQFFTFFPLKNFEEILNLVSKECKATGVAKNMKNKDQKAFQVHSCIGLSACVIVSNILLCITLNQQLIDCFGIYRT